MPQAHRYKLHMQGLLFGLGAAHTSLNQLHSSRHPPEADVQILATEQVSDGVALATGQSLRQEVMGPQVPQGLSLFLAQRAADQRDVVNGSD